MKQKLLILLLGLLGVGCGNNDSPDDLPMPEYGSPHADYRVSGKVTDSAGVPIPGIEVSQWEGYTAAVTDADGNYLVDEADFWSFPSLTFTDPDGPENGGEFEEKTVPVEFTEADRIEPGAGWYGGKFAKTVDVTLDEATAEDPGK